MGLLLVFRTDSAYSRFWIARGIWREAKQSCRGLAITASTQLKYYSPKAATRLLELLIAFPEALAYTCLSGAVPLTDRLDRLIPNELRMKDDPAVCLCLMMQQQLLAAEKESPDAANRITEGRYHMEASSFIQHLVDATTHCEIIVQTRKYYYCVRGCHPEARQVIMLELNSNAVFFCSLCLLHHIAVPWSYSRHTSRFLTIWCGTLPFALVPTFGWLTLPAVMTICWCLFGIEGKTCALFGKVEHCHCLNK